VGRRKKSTQDSASYAASVHSSGPPDSTTEWAKQVVSGGIVSGALMRAAAQRHLDDIASQQKRGLAWKPEKAAAAMEFFPAVLTVTAGAKAGTPFHLPSYVGFVVGSLFGWHRESGLLRFRECWLELGKGMVKTPLSAAIGLYIMGWRGIPRAEVYAIAKDRNQANVLFGDAVSLCRAPIADRPNQSLESVGEVVIRGTGEMSWMIEHPDSGSKFRALANDERISGPKPSMVCADEIHEWPSAAQIELWKAALVKMPNDALLMLTTNTPAADQVMATEMSEFYQGILKKDFEDDSVFSLIARVDETDDPFEDETCWPKALPLLGITYPVENVRNAVRSSRLRIASALTTKRLYFGIPVGGSKYWIDVDAWEAVQGKVEADDHRRDPCYLSLDLSQKNDLTALTAVWNAEQGLRAKTWYWRPAFNVADAARADGAQYVEWAAAGLLNLVPGRSIEYEWVAAKIQELCNEHCVQALAFDPAHIIEFNKACDRIGFKTWVWKEGEPVGDGLKMIVHAQGRAGMHSKQMLWMPRSLGQLEDAILQQQIVIDRSPLTNWCSGNAAIEADAQNNRWFVKKRLRGRIDGVVSLAMAVGLANANLAVEKPPEYRMFILG
jgi:phage terminase large subunit-like protein